MKPALSFQEGPKPLSWQQFPHGDYLRADIERKMEPVVAPYVWLSYA